MKIKKSSTQEMNQFLINSKYVSFDEMYLDWVNNFLTIGGFASYHGISFDLSFRLLEKVCD